MRTRLFLELPVKPHHALSARRPWKETHKRVEGQTRLRLSHVDGCKHLGLRVKLPTTARLRI